jgi:hypothetical protein
MSYLEGVEGSLHGGVQHQRKVLGLPAFYSMQAGATWNDKEFSLLLYQGMPFGALGAMISFSYEKIAKLGDIEAWKKGGVSCKSAHH